MAIEWNLSAVKNTVDDDSESSLDDDGDDNGANGNLEAQWFGRSNNA